MISITQSTTNTQYLHDMIRYIYVLKSAHDGHHNLAHGTKNLVNNKVKNNRRKTRHP